MKPTHRLDPAWLMRSTARLASRAAFCRIFHSVHSFRSFHIDSFTDYTDWLRLKYKNPDECINLYKLWEFHKRRRTVYKFERCHTPKSMIEHDVLKWGPKKIGTATEDTLLGNANKTVTKTDWRIGMRVRISPKYGQMQHHTTRKL